MSKPKQKSLISLLFRLDGTTMFYLRTLENLTGMNRTGALRYCIKVAYDLEMKHQSATIAARRKYGQPVEIPGAPVEIFDAAISSRTAHLQTMTNDELNNFLIEKEYLVPMQWETSAWHGICIATVAGQRGLWELSYADSLDITNDTCSFKRQIFTWDELISDLEKNKII